MMKLDFMFSRLVLGAEEQTPVHLQLTVMFRVL